jgi:hypothetical protein
MNEVIVRQRPFYFTMIIFTVGCVKARELFEIDQFHMLWQIKDNLMITN